MTSTRSRSPLATLALVALVGCSDDGNATGSGGTSSADDSTGSADTTALDTTGTTGDTLPPAVAYYEHVKPILDGRCISCHREGGIGPFALTTYEEAAEWGPAALAAIEGGSMPPWPPAAGCNEYQGNRELTAEQIETIATWIELQTPMGDPANEGAPLPDVAQGLSRVDVTLPMAEAYTPAQSPDDYRCFLIDWPAEYTETTYVTGFRAAPGNGAIVHHVIAFLATPAQRDAYAELDAAEDGPGYTCFGGTGGPSRTWLGGWAPGSAGNEMPDGLGLEVSAGSQIVLQVHYNTASSEPAPDTTAIELKIEPSVETIARVMPWTNPDWLADGGMPIPADEADVVHAWGYDPTALTGGPISVYTAGLHMHQLGTRGTLSVQRASGESECLLQIDAWDFHWQGAYGLAQPVRIEPGDELHIECHWDNSAANQPIVDGAPAVPQDAQWGEGTGDEMCLGIFLTAPAG